MTLDTDALRENFSIELRHCRQVYGRAASIMAFQNSHLLPGKPSEFMGAMEDLYRGLVLKLFISIAYSDGKLSANEEKLAGVLFYQLFQKQLIGDPLRSALKELIPHSETQDWESLVQPFAAYEALEAETVELQTSVVRLGNMIAKADGQAKPTELENLKRVQEKLFSDLANRRPPIQETSSKAPAYESVRQMTRKYDEGAKKEEQQTTAKVQEPEDSLEDALGDLNQLIGLKKVKAEVNQLTNFIKVQQLREKEGLSKNKLSLHMVFGGNPGTGKTTVARLLGRIYGAMGVLQKGHLVETDRSGLVAEYSGQTAPKTNKVIDSAMDGVLFIDEAYSLIADSSEDPFGHEAVQALLKRMEDDRDRLIVILAGYPNEMTRLLESNPGLSSRFAHRIDFADYTPEDLAGIWMLIARKNQYEMNAAAMGKLLVGLQWLFDRRDKHFGNGRLVRNTFEKSIRHLADRIVNSSPITKELLTQIEAADIRFKDVPDDAVSSEVVQKTEFEATCPECDVKVKIEMDQLCNNLKCKKCDHEFEVKSATPLVQPTEETAERDES